jgi:hypothetical protein
LRFPLDRGPARRSEPNPRSHKASRDHVGAGGLAGGRILRLDPNDVDDTFYRYPGRGCPRATVRAQLLVQVQPACRRRPPPPTRDPGRRRTPQPEPVRRPAPLRGLLRNPQLTATAWLATARPPLCRACQEDWSQDASSRLGEAPVPDATTRQIHHSIAQPRQPPGVIRSPFDLSTGSWSRPRPVQGHLSPSWSVRTGLRSSRQHA